MIISFQTRNLLKTSIDGGDCNGEENYDDNDDDDDEDEDDDDDDIDDYNDRICN